MINGCWGGKRERWYVALGMKVAVVGLKIAGRIVSQVGIRRNPAMRSHGIADGGPAERCCLLSSEPIGAGTNRHKPAIADVGGRSLFGPVVIRG